MIGKKCGKHNFKRIELVPTKAEFDSIAGFPYIVPAQQKQKAEQDIIIPGYCIVPPISKPKNKQIPAAYIKTISIRHMMSKQRYVLDSTDECFLHNNLKHIDQNIFSYMLALLEKEAESFNTDFNYIKILQRVISKTNIIMEKQKRHEMYRKIFNYWRNKRKNMRSPLLRLFWVKTEIGPFKSREEADNLCLRNRQIKIQDNEIRQTLVQDLIAIKKILTLMLQREKKQKELLNSQSQNFQKACKKVIHKILNNNKQYAEVKQFSKLRKNKTQVLLQKQYKVSKNKRKKVSLRASKTEIGLQKAIIAAIL